MHVVDKSIGETPLECLERTRLEKGIACDVPMTYAGRLDPLASGKLLILVGEECKEKEKYLGYDKEYEVEVLFGVKTDTGDALGLIEKVEAGLAAMSFFSDVYNVYTLSSHSKKDTPQGAVSRDFLAENRDEAKSSNPFWNKFCGMFTQAYPAYSSKAIGGRQLHDLARKDELPDEMPTKEVEIYSIKEIGKGEQPAKMSGSDVASQAIENISKVSGDFRQKEITDAWKKFEKEYGAVDFLFIKLRVSCSSGTYMRSLAERIGREAGTVAFAFSIKRTKIGKF
ncbi:MAG: hypothetical protein P4L61_03415 [Candidatus Pacebacteria bacterium]|nr:hypothetical protein [Candidatus Paceibacterota bacterium]